MIIIATQIRTGMVLNHNNDLYRVTYMMHVTPGKGQACIQTKLKSIITGKNLEHRFRSNDKVEKADLSTCSMQFLYEEPSGCVFMNNETYDQQTLSEDLLGEQKAFLQDGESYSVTFHESTPVGIDWPKTIDLTVTSAPPAIKKATATSTMRPVTLENGMEILAPGFIKDGDILKVNTDDKSYVERVT